MGKFFFFNREAQERELNEEGKVIPETKIVMGEDGVEKEEPIPGRFKMKTVLRKDFFNLDRVIRCHTVKEGEVVVLLDDGHEEVQKSPKLKNPNKRPPYDMKDFEEVKERVWLQSEIVLKGEDIDRLYKTVQP